MGTANTLIADYHRMGHSDEEIFRRLARDLFEQGRQAELHALLTESPDWMRQSYVA